MTTVFPTATARRKSKGQPTQVPFVSQFGQPSIPVPAPTQAPTKRRSSKITSRRGSKGGQRAYGLRGNLAQKYGYKPPSLPSGFVPNQFYYKPPTRENGLPKREFRIVNPDGTTYFETGKGGRKKYFKFFSNTPSGAAKKAATRGFTLFSLLEPASGRIYHYQGRVRNLTPQELQKLRQGTAAFKGFTKKSEVQSLGRDCSVRFDEVKYPKRRYLRSREDAEAGTAPGYNPALREFEPRNITKQRRPKAPRKTLYPF